MHDALSRLGVPELGVRLTPELVRKAFLQLKCVKKRHKRRIGVGRGENHAFDAFLALKHPFSRGGGGEIPALFTSSPAEPGSWPLGHAGPALKLAPASPCLAGLGLLKDGLQVGLPFIIVSKGV